MTSVLPQQSTGARVRRRHEVLWRATGNGLVLLPPGTSSPVEVHGSARALWDLLAEEVSVDDLVARLRERFGLDDSDRGESAADGSDDRDGLTAQVTRCLTDLADRGAVTWVEP